MKHKELTMACNASPDTAYPPLCTLIFLLLTARVILAFLLVMPILLLPQGLCSDYALCLLSNKAFEPGFYSLFGSRLKHHLFRKAFTEQWSNVACPFSLLSHRITTFIFFRAHVTIWSYLVSLKPCVFYCLSHPLEYEIIKSETLAISRAAVFPTSGSQYTFTE